MMTLMLSSFPYPFAAFILSAIVGVAAIVLRDHLRDAARKQPIPAGLSSPWMNSLTNKAPLLFLEASL